MHCALWLNKHKVYSADEISDNLDIASLRGYFIAGTLTGWLEEHGGEAYAKKLSKLSANDPDLNDKIARIFGGKPLVVKRFGDGSESAPPCRENLCGFSGSFPRTGSSGSFEAAESLHFPLTSSFSQTSFSGGSFNIGSFTFGSGTHKWEWEWLLRYFSSFGSFYGPVGHGSFNIYERLESLGVFMGSFNFGSFGSFAAWELMFANGSFGSFAVPEAFFAGLDEYDLIMLETLARCPLNRFGYGIHNI